MVEGHCHQSMATVLERFDTLRLYSVTLTPMLKFSYPSPSATCVLERKDLSGQLASHFNAFFYFWQH
ncbi:hypothetical protein PVAP13_2KG318167 [Panicum virgatum]|uniref:Uncharacterized protein n=1 Tax=Panicum virgatum TaxID=38727 RepID=A0A8T0W6F0_PANVG|nr:hypothetical protein PVAP13_2KG318167 [Panicum virgatum]